MNDETANQNSQNDQTSRTSPTQKPTRKIPKITNATSSRKPSSIVFIAVFLIYANFLVGAIFLFVTILQEPITETGRFQNWFFKGLALFAPSFMLAMLIVGAVSGIAGRLRGKSQIRHEYRQIKLTNPYQYYKELPNNYGIGVASLLADSTLENEKDIIAALLDLCAQKYLHLSKHSDHYVIRLEPNPTKTPLKNEAYLLDLIRNHRLHEINYQSWYDHCVTDGVALGLYHRPDLVRTRHSSPKPTFRKTRALAFFGAALCFISFFILIPNFSSEFAKSLFTVGITILVVSAIIAYITTIASSVKQLGKTTMEASYKDTLSRHLVKTPLGIQELQKLDAFRAFLAQFNTFVDKDPEAVILWDRYLSYAQVFGLAKELMKSGYHELIDNAAFRIDDINNITLNNITF